MSNLERGQYANEFNDVHLDILHQYFGVDGVPLYCQHSGAGNSDDEDYFDNLDNQITADQQSHIFHDPINVPDHATLFLSTQTENIFFLALKEITDTGIVPSGFWVAMNEWDGGDYPKVEQLKSGHRGKHTDIALPFGVWWLNAVAWAQGLDLMTRLCMIENGDYH